MATALHGSNAGLLINGFNMTSFFTAFGVDLSQAMHDSTVLGNASRLKTPGLREGKLSGSAFFDSTTTTGSWAVLKGMFAGASPGTPNAAIIALAHNGFTVGSPVTVAYATEAQLGTSIIVDDLVKMTMTGEITEDGVDFGVSLHALSAETAFPFDGTTIDNTASSANGGVGTVHVTAIAGAAPNAVIKIQHSSNGTVWVDLITFTAVTVANSSERIEVTGTVNRYLRMTITEGGTTTSVTPVVVFARR